MWEATEKCPVDPQSPRSYYSGYITIITRWYPLKRRPQVREKRRKEKDGHEDIRCRR